jgi:TolA-binding protein
MRFQHFKTVLFLVALASIASAGSAQNTQAKPPALTAAQMVSQGDGVVTNGTALSQTVSGLIREATEDSDMMKVTCLNDKLTQIDGNLRTAQQHLQALRKATDAGVRSHEHTMIMVVGQKLDVLGQEAGQCVGKDLYETGTTTVDTVIDTDMLPFEDNPSVVPTILPPSLPTIPPAISEIR